MRKLSALLTLSAALALPLAAAAASGDPDISKVNGSITVDDGGRQGELNTVNGSIRIGSNARVGEATTVNGSVHVGDSVQTGDLGTVNGSVRVGRNVTVNGDVETVNGSIFVDHGGNISKDVSTVNGGIGLVDTDVGGGIEAVSGDTTVGIGSHVRGGIHYGKPGKIWFSSTRQRDPRVVIGPNARVDGPLVFERKVELLVHSSAVIGPVTGATAVRFDTPTPPAR